MTTNQPSDARDATIAAVRKSYEQQRQAMVLGDTVALDGLLAARFTLTHMTGYLQSKAQWLAEITGGSMQYHAIDDADIEVTFDDDAPVLIASTLTDATIWGTRNTWRLRLRIEFAAGTHGTWTAARTVASTW